LQIKGLGLSLHTFLQRRSVRLGVRTPDFHSGNTGSIPVRTTYQGIKSFALDLIPFLFYIIGSKDLFHAEEIL
jgi:hypothetical protein